MPSTDTVVIGAGHAGLAVSRLLTGRSHDHVVLDRGRVAERWRTERWDSLHLLTPTWMTRLPRWRYEGGDLDGYLPVRAVIGLLERYAASFDAPVREHTTVLDVSAASGGYRVTTDRGTWSARHVVLA
ncbi:MAG: pyridine nucleotide-disulfide oxidoreductase, partial [Nocardioidaceae bacterium]